MVVVTFICIAGLIILVLLAFVFTVAINLPNRAAPADQEEKGPMPKNHGGFGQRVTGGKS